MEPKTKPLSGDIDDSSNDDAVPTDHGLSDAARAEMIRNDPEVIRFKALLQAGIDSPDAGPADEAYFRELQADLDREFGE